MGKSLDGLIELSNLKKPQKIMTLPVKHMVEASIKTFDESIKSREIMVELDIKEDAKIAIEENHFGILFSNLLKNAIQYNTV